MGEAKRKKNASPAALVSTKESREEKNETAKIIIELSPDGELTTIGPTKDPALYLGMLELARSQFTLNLTMAQVRMMQTQPAVVVPQRRIVLPGDLKVPRS